MQILWRLRNISVKMERALQIRCLNKFIQVEIFRFFKSTKSGNLLKNNPLKCEHGSMFAKIWSFKTYTKPSFIYTFHFPSYTHRLNVWYPQMYFHLSSCLQMTCELVWVSGNKAASIQACVSASTGTAAVAIQPEHWMSADHPNNFDTFLNVLLQTIVRMWQLNPDTSQNIVEEWMQTMLLKMHSSIQ